MCPHTAICGTATSDSAIYVSAYYYIYMSAYYYYMCLYTYARILLHVVLLHPILILPYICPHTTIYVSAYYCTCLHTATYVSSRLSYTTMYASSYYYICDGMCVRNEICFKKESKKIFFPQAASLAAVTLPPHVAPAAGAQVAGVPSDFNFDYICVCVCV